MGLVLDHFLQLVVILYDNMPAVQVGVEFLQTEAYQKTLLLNVCMVSLNVSKCFTGKSYGVTALGDGRLYPILASILFGPQQALTCHSMQGLH